MRRIFLILVGLIATTALTAPVALAASPHFKSGGSPTCTITATSSSSDSTTCSAAMAGLGNADLVVTTSTSGSAVYQCSNNGGNIAPGQNKVLVGPATSSTTIPAGEIKNGNLSFTTNPAVLSAPTTVSGAAAGCPNANWTGVNPKLTLTDITLTIEQPPGTVIFTCTASNPNGLSGTVPLGC
jgi:hypothetical protein